MSASYYWLCFWPATVQTWPCLFLYRRHSMWLNNQYWGMHYQVYWCGIKTNKVCWMHSCSSLCNIFNFIFFEQEQSLPVCFFLHWQMPFHTKSHTTSHFIFISSSTFIRYSASSSVSILGISSLPRPIHQFTRDIASCLWELLTFKEFECCGLVMVLNKLLEVPPHVCKGCTVSWLLFMN